ncbi:putative transposable element, partial [Pseudoloma neurophilia]
MQIFKPMTDSEYKDKLTQSFFCGIPDNLKVKFAMHNNMNIHENIESLKKAETQIISNLTKNFNEKTSFLQNDKFERNPLKMTNSIHNKKFCTYHQNSSHNTNDCYNLKNRVKHQNFDKSHDNSKRDQTYGKNNHANSIGNTCKTPVIIHGFFNDCDANILFDTGSSKSFITKDLIDKSNARTKDIEPFEITLADKSTKLVSKKVNSSFVTKLGTELLNLDLNVLDSSNFDIILGSDFLSSNAFVIDYGRGSVQKNKENIEKKSGLIGHSDKNESE